MNECRVGSIVAGTAGKSFVAKTAPKARKRAYPGFLHRRHSLYKRGLIETREFVGCDEEATSAVA